METLPVMATGQLPRGLSSPLADRVMDAHVAGAPQSTKYPAVGVPSATDTRGRDHASCFSKHLPCTISFLHVANARCCKLNLSMPSFVLKKFVTCI